MWGLNTQLKHQHSKLHKSAIMAGKITTNIITSAARDTAQGESRDCSL